MAKGEKTTTKLSKLSPSEFNARFKKATIDRTIKNAEGKEVNNESFNETKWVAKQIANEFSQPTAEVYSLVSQMAAGTYQNDEMLEAIEKIGDNGNGY